MSKHKDRGYYYERTKHNPLEKALADGWEKENIPQAGRNYGHGLLQDLFMERERPFIRSAKPIHRITDDERMIAATVVQWLGTNCGRSFLEECMKEAGYEFVRKAGKQERKDAK
jgi:hypothetical protein